MTENSNNSIMTKPRRTALSAAAILLTLSMAIIAAVPAVNAIEVQTYAYLSVEPNPVGVGQPVLINAWLLPLQPTASDVFHGLTVTVTKPDGGVETRTLTTSTVGSQYFQYVPQMVGNYSVKLTYPGETFTRGGYHYSAAESPVLTLSVQQQPIQPYPDVPIPTDYWTRPINGQNRAWAPIAGDWLMSGYNATGKTFDAAFGFNPYTQAPRSAHIMWTKPLAFGGIVGGYMGDQSYYPGLSYESKASPGIIMCGRLYYAIRPTSSVNQGFVCVDLRTGQELWRNTNWTYGITLGQEFEYTSGNQGGVAGAYLWQTGSTYRMFDAFTGDLYLTFANASTGTNVMDNHGNWYVYVYSGAGRWLAMWNFSRAIDQNRLITYNPSGEGMYRPTPRNVANPADNPYNWLLGIQWNQTNLPANSIVIPDIAPNGTIIANNTMYPSLFGITGRTLLAQIGTSAMIYYEIGYSMDDGRQMWVAARNTTTPSVWGSTGEGKYIRVFLDTRTHRAYDAATGNQVWVSDQMGYPWGTYGSQYGTVAYGKFYWGAYDGKEYAFDMATGKIVWTFASANAGYETPYGSYPFWYGPVIGGGVVFAGTGEHSPTHPFIRGERLFALDAESGRQLWNISGLMVTRSIADGYLIVYNAYDNQLYCFGKGPSATTVQAPLSGVQRGGAITIAGTVVDQSAGQAGTPAIADADISVWMEYLKMQQPIPNGVTIHGVPVTVTATASNGQVTEIGTVLSDMSGHYGLSWTPPAEGLYKITATFVGSDSYGSSYDETFVTVGPAAAAPSPVTPPPTGTTPPTPTPPVVTSTPSASPPPASPPAEAPNTAVYIAVAAVVIMVVVVAVAVVLRRRK
ncbi:MAG: PQQ-binding-like beta-propeller repeat protein [Candidatus Bathyarchaeia archaeon]